MKSQGMSPGYDNWTETRFYPNGIPDRSHRSKAIRLEIKKGEEVSHYTFVQIPIPSVRNILSSSVSRSRNGDSSLLKCVRTLGGGREKSALFALAGKRVILGRINEGKRIERGLFGLYYVYIYISGVSRGIHNAVLGVLQYVYDHTPTPWPNVISF